MLHLITHVMGLQMLYKCFLFAGLFQPFNFVRQKDFEGDMNKCFDTNVAYYVNNFEVVGRGRETQLQVCEKFNNCIFNNCIY